MAEAPACCLGIRDFLAACADDAHAIPLTLVAGEQGLDKQIRGPELNRPGLGLVGFFDNFASSRIQIFGLGETAFVRDSYRKGEGQHLVDFFRFDLGCCIFTHDAAVPEEFLGLANQHHVPVFVTSLPTAELVRKAEFFLEDFFAPRLKVHGVLMEIFGLGVLMIGKSGIGKSECALELIERGHRLVADDVVDVRCISGSLLVGRCSSVIPHHMEVRGLGIINISMLFGVGAIRDSKQLQMVVQLEPWDEAKEYERTGLDDATHEILGVRLPFVTVPISPVRNVPVIIETAAMNQRLKKLGFHAAREFDRRLRTLMSERAGGDGHD